MSLKASASQDKESSGLFPLSYTINIGTGTAPTDHKSASKREDSNIYWSRGGRGSNPPLKTLPSSPISHSLLLPDGTLLLTNDLETFSISGLMQKMLELRDRAKTKRIDLGEMKHRIQGVKEKAMEVVRGIESRSREMGVNKWEQR